MPLQAKTRTPPGSLPVIQRLYTLAACKVSVGGKVVDLVGLDLLYDARLSSAYFPPSVLKRARNRSRMFHDAHVNRATA